MCVGLCDACRNLVPFGEHVFNVVMQVGKRAVRLVYEFLVRRLSQSMVERNQQAIQKTLDITRKYFGDETPLAEERELFDVIKNARGLTETAARRVIGEVQRMIVAFTPPPGVRIPPLWVHCR